MAPKFPGLAALGALRLAEILTLPPLFPVKELFSVSPLTIAFVPKFRLKVFNSKLPLEKVMVPLALVVWLS